MCNGGALENSQGFFQSKKLWTINYPVSLLKYVPEKLILMERIKDKIQSTQYRLDVTCPFYKQEFFNYVNRRSLL